MREYLRLFVFMQPSSLALEDTIADDAASRDTAESGLMSMGTETTEEASKDIGGRDGEE